MQELAKEIDDENNGLWYTLGEDDIYYPNLTLPEQEEVHIGKYGRMRERYLKNHKRPMYLNLLTACKLAAHLADIDSEAKELFSRLVEDIAKSGGVDEKLKAADQMKWVGLMNNIRSCADEIVLSEIVYA
jgi:hypothetical protein